MSEHPSNNMFTIVDNLIDAKVGNIELFHNLGGGVQPDFDFRVF